MLNLSKLLIHDDHIELHNLTNESYKCLLIFPGILKQHTAFFTTSGLRNKIEECLRNLARLSKTFTEKMPENLVLQVSFITYDSSDSHFE